MELIWTQPGFKYCNEPLDIRNKLVAENLGIRTWQELYSSAASDKIETYFRGICSGQLRFNEPNPFRRYYRPITRRIVFKELHAGHDRIAWFNSTFNGRAVYLVRHPIAVSLSREVFATLNELLGASYRQHFSKEELSFAHEVLASGTRLERGVLAWCLQNAVPLRHTAGDWAMVSYEQLILEPRVVIDYLSAKLDLPEPERMLRALNVPSLAVRESDQVTRGVLEKGAHERAWLVDKWKERVSEAEERHSMDILEHFGLNTYRAGTSLPSPPLWVGAHP
jgi:hypothetical protein